MVDQIAEDLNTTTWFDVFDDHQQAGKQCWLPGLRKATG
jgi:hypothetical protein